MLDIIRKAAAGAGGIEKLAAAMGVSRQAFHLRAWSERVPAERVLDMERASNGAVTRQEIRPDLFGEPANNAGRDAAA